MTRRLFAAITFIMLLCLSSSVFAQHSTSRDWPQWLGPNADGISPITGINKTWNSRPPKELWRISMHDDGYAGPSIADSKLFIVDHNGAEDVVRAISIKTGKELWRTAYPESDKPNFGFCRSTPVYTKGKLIVISRLGVLNCLSSENGKLLWKRDLATEYAITLPIWQISFTPRIDGDKIIVCPGGKDTSVVAIDLNGKTVMEGGGGGVTGYAAPVIATITGVKQYVIFMAKSIMGLDAANLKTLWTIPFSSFNDINASTPVVIGDSIFATANTQAALIDITKDGAKQRWESKELASLFTTPIYWKGYLYYVSVSGHLMCVRPETGTIVWKKEGFEKGQVTAVDGVLLVVNGAAGDVAMVNLNAKAYEEIGRTKPLSGQSWTAPIIAEDRLIIRNKSTLVCLELR